MAAAKKRTTPKPPTLSQQKKEKRKKTFQQGDFVRNLENDTLILLVTKTPEESSEAFHGTIIQTDKQRTVGDSSMFWLKNRFELIKVNIEIL